jgi:hypothetical protein
MVIDRIRAAAKTYEHRLAFDELGIKAEAVEARMGCGEGRVSGPFPAQIRKSLATAADSADIRGGYVFFEDAGLSKNSDSLNIDAHVFSIGKIIGTQLSGMEAVAVFVCTAGSEISALAKKLTENGELIQAFVLDAIASETVERSMDKIQEKLAGSVQAGGHKISRRYSPGYCGWPVSDQHDLFALLPENFCGVRLTAHAMMQPLKSVSGIIGIGRQVKQQAYPCRICEIEDCLYRSSDAR